MGTLNGSTKKKVGLGTFTRSPETTFVTHPLDADGYPDYVAALNERLREGVTPDNNAFVRLVQALSSRSEEAKPPDAFFEMLAISRPANDKPHFVSFAEFAKEHLGTDPTVSETVDDPESVENSKMVEIYNQTELTRKRAWSRRDFPLVSKWLEVNEKALGMVIEASNRPRYYSPIVPLNPEKGLTSAVGSLSSVTSKCHDTTGALSARAMLKVGERKLDEAWRDLLAGFRISRLIGRGGTLIEVLVSNALEMAVARTGLALLEFAKATSEQLARWAEDLRQLPPRSPVAGKVDLGDRIFMLESILLVNRRGMSVLKGDDELVPTRFEPCLDTARDSNGQIELRNRSFQVFFEIPKQFEQIDNAGLNGVKWDLALQNANRWFDRLASGMRLPDRASRQRLFAEFDRELKQIQHNLDKTKASDDFAFTSPDVKGKLLVDELITLAMPTMLRVQQSADRAEQYSINLDLAFALARYHADHGAFPNRLSELAPKYLAAIPNDLFSKQPPIYKLSDDGYLLYSVGPNGIDDGGRGPWDDPRGDDIAVSMPSSG